MYAKVSAEGQSKQHSLIRLISEAEENVIETEEDDVARQRVKDLLVCQRDDAMQPLRGTKWGRRYRQEFSGARVFKETVHRTAATFQAIHKYAQK